MTPRLIDQILSIDGFMIGVSYVLAWSAVLCIVSWIMDRYETRRMNRMISRAINEDRRNNPEDAARWTP